MKKKFAQILINRIFYPSEKYMYEILNRNRKTLKKKKKRTSFQFLYREPGYIFNLSVTIITGQVLIALLTDS